MPAEYVSLYEVDPGEIRGGTRTWYVRGRNFVLAYSVAEAGATFERDAQPDEYVVLLPDSGAEIETTGGTSAVGGVSIAFVPPARSAVRMADAGQLVRLFTTASVDLAAKCVNAASYAEPRPQVAPFRAWPEPSSGLRLRRYSLDVAPEEGRFGRIFRCTRFMVNWREDEHLACGSPSVVVIPPPVIHTSQWLGNDLNVLVDVFCPPRLDFSQQPGWVLNAGDYPIPR